MKTLGTIHTCRRKHRRAVVRVVVTVSVTRVVAVRAGWFEGGRRRRHQRHGRRHHCNYHLATATATTAITARGQVAPNVTVVSPRNEKYASSFFYHLQSQSHPRSLPQRVRM